MDLLKKLTGQGLILTLHEDGCRLLVGSKGGVTQHQRELITSNKLRLIAELKSHPAPDRYHSAEWLPLPLLPGDVAYVNGTLAHRPETSVHQLLCGYIEVWIRAAATEPQDQKKENAGRRAANTWLREYQH